MSNSNSVNAHLLPEQGDTGRTLGWKMMLEAAKLASQQDDIDKAEQLYKHALEKAEHRIGPNHVLIAYLLMEMAEFYFSQDEYGSAHLLHNRARDILCKHVEDAHTAFQ